MSGEKDDFGAFDPALLSEPDAKIGTEVFTPELTVGTEVLTPELAGGVRVKLPEAESSPIPAEIGTKHKPYYGKYRGGAVDAVARIRDCLGLMAMLRARDLTPVDPALQGDTTGHADQHSTANPRAIEITPTPTPGRTFSDVQMDVGRAYANLAKGLPLRGFSGGALDGTPTPSDVFCGPKTVIDKMGEAEEE